MCRSAWLSIWSNKLRKNQSPHSRDVICSGFSQDSLYSNPLRQKQSSGKNRNYHIPVILATMDTNMPLSYVG